MKLIGKLTKLHSGIYLDATPFKENYVWETCNNVIFNDDSIRSMAGQSERGSISAIGSDKTILGFGQNISEGNTNLILGTWNAIYRQVGSGNPVTRIGSGFTGTFSAGVNNIATQWSFEPWGSWILATNGINAPQIWRGSLCTSAMGKVTFTRAEIFKRFRDIMFAFNTNVGSNSIHWSDANDPDAWSISANVLSGSYVIRETDSAIRAASRIGGSLSVYSLNKVYLFPWVGYPLIIDLSLAIDGVGALSKNSVVELSQANYGVGINGFYHFTESTLRGGNISYIDDPAVRSWFFDNLNFDQSSKITAFHDEISRQIIWSFPLVGSGDNSAALGYDYIRKTWTYYDQGWTATLARGIMANAVIGQTNGQFFNLHSGEGKRISSGNITVTACATSNAFHFEDPSAVKFIRGIRVGTSVSPKNLNIRIGVQDRLDQSIIWGSFKKVNYSGEFIPVNMSGKYARVKLRTETLSVNWSVQSIEFFGEFIGKRPD